MGGSAGTLALTGPQVALIVAGLMGATYTIDHADDIYLAMNNCIDSAMSGIDNAAEQVSGWWDKAKAGIIDTASSVWSGVCDWVCY